MYLDIQPTIRMTRSDIVNYATLRYLVGCGDCSREEFIGMLTAAVASRGTDRFCMVRETYPEDERTAAAKKAAAFADKVFPEVTSA
jgi:hypothetical protein